MDLFFPLNIIVYPPIVIINVSVVLELRCREERIKNHSGQSVYLSKECATTEGTKVKGYASSGSLSHKI